MITITKEQYIIGGAFVGGVVLGAGAVRIFLENKLREEMQFKVDSLEIAYEAAIALRDAREPLEDHHQPEIDFDEIPLAEVHPTDFLGPVVNQYRQAVEIVETPVEMFVDGGINDYGVSYIEEEEFDDSDGRDKGHIDIMMGDQEPMFLMDGLMIDDWDERLGDSIMVDFYRLVPPGSDQVLYVRNHRTNWDYEVVRVIP